MEGGEKAWVTEQWRFRQRRFSPRPVGAKAVLGFRTGAGRRDRALWPLGGEKRSKLTFYYAGMWRRGGSEGLVDGPWCTQQCYLSLLSYGSALLWIKKGNRNERYMIFTLRWRSRRTGIVSRHGDAKAVRIDNCGSSLCCRLRCHGFSAFPYRLPCPVTEARVPLCKHWRTTTLCNCGVHNTSILKVNELQKKTT